MATSVAPMDEALPGTTRRGWRVLDWRVGGVLLGALVTLAVALQGPLGISSAYVTTDAMLLDAAGSEAAANNPYLSKVGPHLTPEYLVVGGVLLGGLLAGLLSRSRGQGLPRHWRERFGQRSLLRFTVAGIGGFLLLFGARLAGGCTSGHVISGMSQLALSGMVFAAAVFASGIPTARLLYRRKS
ncbi:MAG: YeeE/YedE family protein [Myxococcota bacterium]|nr:YeeE/YedE family protein [Myxococcota bacterium]